MHHPRSACAALTLLALVGCRSAEVKLQDTADTDADTDTDTDADTDTGDTSVIVQGDLAVSPASIDLPVLFVGQAASADVTLTNVGDGPVSATLSFVGGWATSYTLDAYTSSLLAGESSTHTLTLTPTTWGDHSVGLIIDSDTGAHIEVPVTAKVEEDNDGDGYGSTESGGDDCDDTDDTLNPGATDTWYDGIDSDCAGNDDYDQDGDGVEALAGGGTDCNDLDASISPDLADTWYDGIDTDCAGDDDYDQDGDGFVPDEYVGLPTEGVDRSGRLPGGDCDDTDGAINPHAVDAWYDGIDTDCGGEDDYDQDGDGHDSADYTGDDCDDTDATAYPGATETWYDGVDGDCLGGDDFDQDLDGVDFPSDCDDTDPAVAGPVPETLNGADDDCNGLIDDFEIGDVATGTLYGYSTSMALGDHGTMAMTDDVTGDGAPDLVVGAHGSGYGTVWVVDGATGATANDEIRYVSTAAYAGESDHYPLSWVNGPWCDEDGDGVTDFVFGGWTDSSSTPYGRSYVFLGGAAVTGAISLASTDADVRISTDDYYDDSSMASIADVDGDGLGDVVVGSDYDDGVDANAGSLAIFLGGALTGQLDLGDADDRIYGADGSDALGCSLTLADIDDDGYADMIAGASGYDGSSSSIGAVYLVGGNALGAWSSKVDAASLGSVIGNSRSLALGEDSLAHPGDVDGDGKLDLAVTSESDGSVWVFLDASSIAADTSVSSASHTISGTAGDMGSMVVMDSDLDNDGADELVVGADGDNTNGSNSGTVYVFSDAATWGSAMTAADAVATFYGPSNEGYFGTGGAGGMDLNADGIDDLAIGASSNDDNISGGGAVFIVPGW